MPACTRRSLLRMGAAAMAPRPALAATVPALKREAARCGLLIGGESDVVIATAPEAYAALLRDQCSLISPQLTWGSVAPQPDGQDPQWEDPNIAFARHNGMRLTGGHLLWHEDMPDWINDLSSHSLQSAIERHIDHIVRRYAGQIYSWNVVNEAIDTRNGDDLDLRRSLFLQRLGPGFIPAAFRLARAADPHALLVYNEYSLEMDTRLEAGRRDALRRLLDRVQGHAPIDAVGLQSHLRLDSGRFSPDLYARFLEELAGRGLKILITELDVLDVTQATDPVARDAQVAALYGEFLTAALSQPAVCSLTFWGLSDRYTWLTLARGPRFGRPDGLPTRPCLFDAAFKAKPAFTMVLEAVRKAPRRG